MNREQFEGNWHQLKGKIKEKWGKLTDDDVAIINGKYEQFVGKLQERYGYSKEQAEKESRLIQEKCSISFISSRFNSICKCLLIDSALPEILCLKSEPEKQVLPLH